MKLIRMIYDNTFMEEYMEQFIQLLTDLECISLQDISEIPEDLQHEIAEQIEQLQDKLKRLNESSCSVK
jgi:hypothetical protein